MTRRRRIVKKVWPPLAALISVCQSLFLFRMYGIGEGIVSKRILSSELFEGCMKAQPLNILICLTVCGLLKISLNCWKSPSSEPSLLKGSCKQYVDNMDKEVHPKREKDSLTAVTFPFASSVQLLPKMHQFGSEFYQSTTDGESDFSCETGEAKFPPYEDRPLLCFLVSSQVRNKLWELEEDLRSVFSTEVDKQVCTSAAGPLLTEADTSPMLLLMTHHDEESPNPLQSGEVSPGSSCDQLPRDCLCVERSHGGGCLVNTVWILIFIYPCLCLITSSLLADKYKSLWRSLTLPLFMILGIRNLLRLWEYFIQSALSLWAPLLHLLGAHSSSDGDFGSLAFSLDEITPHHYSWGPKSRNRCVAVSLLPTVIAFVAMGTHLALSTIGSATAVATHRLADVCLYGPLVLVLLAYVAALASCFLRPNLRIFQKGKLMARIHSVVRQFRDLRGPPLDAYFRAEGDMRVHTRPGSRFRVKRSNTLPTPRFQPYSLSSIM